MEEIDAQKDILIEEQENPEELEEQTFLVKEEDMSSPHKESEIMISDDDEYEYEIVTTLCEKIQGPVSYISPVQVNLNGYPVNILPNSRTFRKCYRHAALKDEVSGIVVVVIGFCCEMKGFKNQYQVDDETAVNMMARKLQNDFDEKNFSECTAYALRFALHKVLMADCDNEEKELITCDIL